MVVICCVISASPINFRHIIREWGKGSRFDKLKK